MMDDERLTWQMYSRAKAAIHEAGSAEEREMAVARFREGTAGDLADDLLGVLAREMEGMS